MELSTASKVRLRMPLGGAGGGPLEVVLTQQDLERLSAPLFRRARLPIDQACWQARFSCKQCQFLRCLSPEESRLCTTGSSRRGLPC